VVLARKLRQTTPLTDGPDPEQKQAFRSKCVIPDQMAR